MILGTYNPESAASRRELAEHMIAQLESWGFEEGPQAGSERVFVRCLDFRLECRVYTSISGSATRAKDTDAIRVSLIYTGTPPRPLGKSPRVYRKGVIPEIVGRIKERVDEIEASVAKLQRCHCGAPKFTSGKGNKVCAALCWKRAEAREQPETEKLVAPEPRRAPPAARGRLTPAKPAASTTAPVERTGRRRADAPRGRAW